MLSTLSDISVLWISRSSLCPGISSAEHVHDFFQFCYYKQGTVKTASRAIHGPGYCFCAAPHTIHGGETFLSTTETLDIKFIVNNPSLSLLLRRFSFDHLEMDDSSKMLLDGIMDDITRYKPKQEMLNAALSHFFWRLLSLHENLSDTSGSAADSACDRIIEYINNNYSHPITLSDIAEYAGLSRSYTSSIFSANLGMTINEYLNLVRIREASLLISYSDTPIGEIYEKCGFNDWRNFGRNFQKVIGVSPSIYRKAFSANDLKYDSNTCALQDVSFDDISAEVKPFTYAVAPRKLIMWGDYYSFVRQEI